MAVIVGSNVFALELFSDISDLLHLARVFFGAAASFTNLCVVMCGLWYIGFLPSALFWGLLPLYFFQLIATITVSSSFSSSSCLLLCCLFCSLDLPDPNDFFEQQVPTQIIARSVHPEGEHTFWGMMGQGSPHVAQSIGSSRCCPYALKMRAVHRG